MIEQEIHDMLKSKVRHAPSLDEPPAPVLRRARGRRALNAAGVVGALALVAVGSFIGVRSLDTTESTVLLNRLPVPWKAIPNGPDGIGGIDPCRASDVRLSADAGTGAALGFTPRSDLIRCSLAPGFKVELFDAVGRKLDVPVRFAKTFPGLVVYNSESTNLALFEWANGCAPTTGPIRFRVTLPAGGRLSATATNGGEIACTGSRSTTSMTINAGATRPSGYVRRDALDSLTVTLSQVPRTVRAGTGLRYLVTLSNLTDTSVRLDPCPDYNQGLVILDNSLSHGQTNKLNCAEAPDEIRPHTRVVFEMLFHIPSGANAAPAELTWSFARPGFGRVDEVKTRITVTH